jgi:hypothetical protein
VITRGPNTFQRFAKQVFRSVHSPPLAAKTRTAAGARWRLTTHPMSNQQGRLATPPIELGFSFPYCLDATQDVARAYKAACTPDFFLFDGDHKLAYRRQLDDSRPRSDKPVTGHDLRAAIEALLHRADSRRSETQPGLQHKVACLIA